VFTIGGAQAVAALAYGTQTIPRVDKIVGPGNAYVAAAKRRVFGVVGIDMVAGPSEILVICDGQTNPDWVAMDLFSQAEHDELAQSVLICPDAAYIERVAASLDRLLPTMPRQQVIRAALENRGALIQVRDLDEACGIANRIAPEHLELSVSRCRSLGRENSSRRCDLHRPLHFRIARRLLRRPQPRPADFRQRPFLVTAGGLRFPEANQPDPRLPGRREDTRSHRGNAGVWRGPAGACRARPSIVCDPGKSPEPWGMKEIQKGVSAGKGRFATKSGRTRRDSNSRPDLTC
jgi:hypothetical protein